jgi:hypothetical protein
VSGFLFQGGAGKALSFVERPLDVDFGLFLELEFVELEFFELEGLALDEGIVLGVWGFEVEGLLDRERYSSYTADAGTRNTLHSPSYPWRSSSSPLWTLRPFPKPLLHLRWFFGQMPERSAFVGSELLNATACGEAGAATAHSQRSLAWSRASRMFREGVADGFERTISGPSVSRRPR